MSATGVPIYQASAGTTLSYGTFSGSPTYSTSFAVRKFGSLPEIKIDSWEITQVDAINGDGTPDLNKYFSFGKADPGELMFTVSAANLAAVYALLDSVKRSWKVTFSLLAGQTIAATLTFAGAVTDVKPTVNEKDEVLCDVTVKLSDGKPVYTAGSSGD